MSIRHSGRGSPGNNVGVSTRSRGQLSLSQAPSFRISPYHEQHKLLDKLQREEKKRLEAEARRLEEERIVIEDEDEDANHADKDGGIVAHTTTATNKIDDIMPFSDLAAELEYAHLALNTPTKSKTHDSGINSEDGGGGRRAAQLEIVRGLVSRIFLNVNNKDRKREALYALLQILMPSEDRQNVYGMKTRRLMSLMADAIGNFRPEVAARLRSWQPTICRSPILPPNQNAIVSLPEVQIAALVPTPPPNFFAASLMDISRACKQLTMAYLMQGADEVSSMSEDTDIIINTSQRGVLSGLIGKMDNQGWILFLRVLLKNVSIGIGPATVLAGLPLPGAGALYARQRSLSALADACCSFVEKDHAVEGGAATNDKSKNQIKIAVQCGIAFTPQTCECMRMPYLLKWIFSREEQLRHPITPIHARLLILLEKGNWYVPLNNSDITRMVNLEEDQALHVKNRKRHLLLLREFKKANMINIENAKGYILHYTLSAESHGLIVFLLRDVSEAFDGGVQIADDIVAMEPVLPETKQMSKKDLLMSFIRHPLVIDIDGNDERGEGKSEIVYSGKNRLQVVTAAAASGVIGHGASGKRNNGSSSSSSSSRKKKSGITASLFSAHVSVKISKSVAEAIALNTRSREAAAAAAIHNDQPQKNSRKTATKIASTVAEQLRRGRSAAKPKSDDNNKTKKESSPKKTPASTGPILRSSSSRGIPSPALSLPYTHTHEQQQQAAHPQKKGGDDDDKRITRSSNRGAGESRVYYNNLDASSTSSSDVDDDVLEHGQKGNPNKKRQEEENSKSKKKNQKRKGVDLEEEEKDREHIIAQIKLDGDRLQAHVSAAADREGVKLFSKNGLDVSHLYSDVQNDLYNAIGRGIGGEGEVPCILDGEIIVVDAAGKPLPWENQKWRYNKCEPLEEEAAPESVKTIVTRLRSAARSATTTTIEEESGGIIALEYSESELAGGSWEDGEDQNLSFLPASR